MKTLLFLLILAASQAAYTQKYNWRKAIAPASFALVSGAAYHRVTLFGAGISAGIVYNRGEKRKWWHYAVDAAITYAAFTVGFHSIYSLAF